MIGKNVSTYYPADYVYSRQNELVSTVLREGTRTLRTNRLATAGTPLQTLQSTFLIRDENGNPLRMAVVITNVTERKREKPCGRARSDFGLHSRRPLWEWRSAWVTELSPKPIVRFAA